MAREEYCSVKDNSFNDVKDLLDPSVIFALHRDVNLMLTSLPYSTRVSKARPALLTL